MSLLIRDVTVLTLTLCRQVVMNNLHKLPHAPSVQLQEVPRQSLADILGRKPQDLEDEDESMEFNPAALSDLDDRIQSSWFFLPDCHCNRSLCVDIQRLFDERTKDV